MWYHKKVKSMVLLSNEEFGYFGKWHQKSAALKQSRKKMRCTCMQLSPSVNCLSVSLAIELSLLHFICNENAKESCLALSSSLTETNSEAHGGAPPSAHILGFSVKPPSRRSLSPCSSPASFAHCSLASQPHGHGCRPQPLHAEIPLSSASHVAPTYQRGLHNCSPLPSVWLYRSLLDTASIFWKGCGQMRKYVCDGKIP